MSSDVTIPVVDLTRYLESGERTGLAREDCEAVARALEQFGVVVVRDSRVPTDLSAEFLRLTERYFGQPDTAKRLDERADLGHQTGWTPPYTELPRDHMTFIDAGRLSVAGEENLPRTFHEWRVNGRRMRKDPKERFFAPFGPRPTTTKYPSLNAPPVVPGAFPEWTQITGRWSEFMLGTIMTTLELAAIGFGMEADAFTQLMRYAPHLLAPTGSDLKLHGLGTVLAGFHNDLNLLTGHGRSNYPGLFAWTRDWQRFSVRVPQGCFLMQAGMQLERLTGGRVLPGFHEVVVTDDSSAQAQAALAEGRSPWRVTSTLFAHAGSEAILEPIGPFRTDEALLQYPPIEAGQQVADEIRLLCLDTTQQG